MNNLVRKELIWIGVFIFALLIAKSYGVTIESTGAIKVVVEDWSVAFKAVDPKSPLNKTLDGFQVKFTFQNIGIRDNKTEYTLWNLTLADTTSEYTSEWRDNHDGVRINKVTQKINLTNAMTDNQYDVEAYNSTFAFIVETAERDTSLDLHGWNLSFASSGCKISLDYKNFPPIPISNGHQWQKPHIFARFSMLIESTLTSNTIDLNDYNTYPIWYKDKIFLDDKINQNTNPDPIEKMVMWVLDDRLNLTLSYLKTGTRGPCGKPEIQVGKELDFDVGTDRQDGFLRILPLVTDPGPYRSVELPLMMNFPPDEAYGQCNDYFWDPDMSMLFRNSFGVPDDVPPTTPTASLPTGTPVSPTEPLAALSPNGDATSSTGAIIGAVIVVVCVIAGIIAGAIWWWRRQNANRLSVSKIKDLQSQMEKERSDSAPPKPVNIAAPAASASASASAAPAPEPTKPRGWTNASKSVEVRNTIYQN